MKIQSHWISLIHKYQSLNWFSSYPLAKVFQWEPICWWSTWLRKQKWAILCHFFVQFQFQIHLIFKVTPLNLIWYLWNFFVHFFSLFFNDKKLFTDITTIFHQPRDLHMKFGTLLHYINWNKKSNSNLNKFVISQWTKQKYFLLLILNSTSFRCRYAKLFKDKVDIETALKVRNLGINLIFFIPT